MIQVVDQGLERLLRAALPLPDDTGDVSFETPDGGWGARLSRPAVNLFLYDVARSPTPPGSPAVRPGEDGRVERRAALPMVWLRYAVTAWAVDPGDEHRLLGDVLGCLLEHPVVPAAHLPVELPAPVRLAVAMPGDRKPGDVWSAIGGRLRAGFDLDVTVALDRAWVAAAAPVERTEARVTRYDDGAPAPVPPAPAARAAAPAAAPAAARRQSATSVVAERGTRSGG